MQILVDYDQDQASLPAGFVTAINYVVSYYDSIFANPAAITIDVGYGEIGAKFGYGGAAGVGKTVTAGGESLSVFNGQLGGVYVAPDYSTVRSALINQETPGATTLPTNPPAGNPGTLAMTPAEAMALQLTPDTSDVVGVVGFSSAPNVFSYAPGIAPSALETYFVGVVEHEFSEIMGRTSWLNGIYGVAPPAYSVMDMYRYSASGVRDFSVPAPPPYSTAYFSIDGGSGNLDTWNTDPGTGDIGDWAASAGNDAFDAVAPPGVENLVTPTDLTLMSVLGWDVAASWNSAVSGDFAAGSNWNTGDVPNSTIGAIIGEPGTYTVTSSENNTIDSLSITDANTTLSVAAGVFTVDGTLNNAGDIDVNGGTLVIQGNAMGGAASIEGSGTLEFGAASNVDTTFSASRYTYTALTDPAGNLNNTFPADINDAGQIVENSGNGDQRSYLYSNGTYTALHDPLATRYQQAWDANASHQVVGIFQGDGSGYHGFLYSGGSYTTIDGPSGTGIAGADGVDQAAPIGINDAGELFGNTSDLPFLCNVGSYTTLNDPSAFSGYRQIATGINDAGQVVGDYFDIAAAGHGFIYSGGSAGTYQTLTDPFSIPPTGEGYSSGNRGTFVTGVNNVGQVIGYYYDSTGSEHGFLYSNGQYTTIDDPLAVHGTYPVGINDAGQTVGNYFDNVSNPFDSVGTEHGFLYSGGGYTTIDAPSAVFTIVEGMNDEGQVVDINYNSYEVRGIPGLLASPGVNNTLKLDDPSHFTGTIFGFAVGDTIDLPTVGYDSAGSAVLDSGNVLHVTEDGATYSWQLDPSQDFSSEFFHLAPDAGLDSEVIVNRFRYFDATVNDGQTQTVASGESASGSTVLGGGTLSVNGLTNGTTLSGGVENLSSGGVDLSGTITGGGQQYVSVGGSAIEATIDSGGSQFISGGGTAANTTVNDGGHQYVEPGGSAFGSILNDPGVQIISSGGTAINTTVSGGEQDVYGTASGTTVSSGGLQVVENGATASGTIVDNGGIETVLAGGTEISATISSGAVENVYGSAADTAIDNGASVTAYDGNTLQGTIVDNGTLIFDLTGSDTIAATLTGSGTLIVDGGSLIINSPVVNSGSGEAVINDGTLEFGAASNVDITFSHSVGSASGNLSVTPVEDLSGTSTVPRGINNLGQIVGYYGDHAFLDSSGTYTTLDYSPNVYDTQAYAINDLGQIVGSYSDASGQHGFIYSNGIFTALYGPSGIDLVPTGINDEGQIVGFYESNVIGKSEGTALHGFLESDGAFTALDDPSATWATVAEGINNLGQIVGYYSYLGGFAERGFIYGAGAYSDLNASYPTGINDAGRIVGSQPSGGSSTGYVYSNGIYTILHNEASSEGRFDYDLNPSSINDESQIVGSYFFVNSAGFLATVSQGNTLKLDDASEFKGIISGFASGDTIVLTSISYDSGGTADLDAASNQLVITENGQTYDLNFDPSQKFSNEYFHLAPDAVKGTDVVVNVFRYFDSTVTNGSQQTVLSGAVAFNTTVNSGGYQYLSSGGVAAGSTVNDGGFQFVELGGTANDTLISDPGTQIVSLGGMAGNTTVSGGEQDVYGTAIGTTVSDGGLQIVENGGSASDTDVDNGAIATVLDGGTLLGSVINDGTVNFNIAGSASFAGTLTGSGALAVTGGGDLDVVSAYTGAAQVDDTSTLEVNGAYVGVTTFSGSPTGPGGTVKFDSASTGPINVVNPNDTVSAQAGSDNWINATVSYTLPANVDALFLYTGAEGTGNSDAAGDALYALDAGSTQTLTGNSPNDTFVVYNSSDVVTPQAGSHDVVYAAVSYTLPTGVDALILEGTATEGGGNSDAAGDALYAANPGQVATLTGNSPNDTFAVYNSADVVVPKAGSNDVVYSAASYTLPTGVDVLILEAGTQAVGNSDATGDALYAANPGEVATLTGNSLNDTFVLYNSADVVVPKAGGHDLVYSAVNYTLPTGVDSLILEAGTQAVGNSDASGDTLYAADAGIAQTLTGNSTNDTFVVYNPADTVVGQASSVDTIYAAVNFTLPTNVDTLFLEGAGATHGTGNNDAVDTLFGNAGIASTLVAGSGVDLLAVTGTAGTIMTGGSGADTFAFPSVMGHDEITNFDFTKDTLQFNATLFSNFTAAMNDATQAGANTVLTIDANDTVTLDNVTKTSLAAGNFHFV